MFSQRIKELQQMLSDLQLSRLNFVKQGLDVVSVDDAIAEVKREIHMYCLAWNFVSIG